HNGTGTLSGTPAAGSGGTYPITFTATNSAGNTPQNFTLTVNHAPAITTAAANQTVCAGATATFTAAASGFPTPSVQWQLSTDAGVTFTNIGGATSTSYSTSTGTNGNQYRAHFTNAAGSADTTATLTVNPNPTATISGPTSVCVGASAQLTANPSGGTAPYTYSWSPGGQTTASINPSTSTAGSTLYTVTVTDSKGCTATASQTLTVNAIPAQPTITTGGPLTFCQGGSVTLTSSSASGNQWYKNGTAISGQTGQQYS